MTNTDPSLCAVVLICCHANAQICSLMQTESPLNQDFANFCDLGTSKNSIFIKLEEA